jgi:hypothetical protein
MPLFLFLLGVYNYVFWGILVNRKRKGKDEKIAHRTG